MTFWASFTFNYVLNKLYVFIPALSFTIIPKGLVKAKISVRGSFIYSTKFCLLFFCLPPVSVLWISLQNFKFVFQTISNIVYVDCERPPGDCMNL